MNQTVLVGRITKDPEIRYTTGSTGLAVVAFTLACDRGKNKDGSKVTDFVPCKAWGKTAEVIGKFVKKGAKIGCIGHIETGSFTKKDGSKGFSVEVNVNKVEFYDHIGDKPEPVPQVPDDFPEDLPM